MGHMSQTLLSRALKAPAMFNSRNNPVSWELSLSPFHRWGYGSLGRSLGSHSQ